jgi:ATP-dependent Lhr-like helicase
MDKEIAQAKFNTIKIRNPQYAIRNLMIDPLELKAQLHYSWRAFFARHGSFTRVQVEAMPPVLAGGNVLIVAPTASGKTEAGLVPLLERYLLGEQRKEGERHASFGGAGLRVLYICATRVSVRDLYQRLLSPFESLGLSLAMKSGDVPFLSLSEQPSVLITTPESTDSLLARVPRLFTELSAIVLDDIHFFDLGVRGDHLRCLLARIERIREYSHRLRGLKFQPLQRVALSLTGVDSNALIARYLMGREMLPRTPLGEGWGEGTVQGVEVGGGGESVADLVPMAGVGKLVGLLNVRIKRKTLIFCNTRYEVEQVAAYLRYHLAYKALILVHYSTLEPLMRRQVERSFAQATVALCVSSPSLELGLDIGTIDEVILVGAPSNVFSFLQRIGRAARRRQTIPVLCLYRSLLEELQFQA